MTKQNLPAALGGICIAFAAVTFELSAHFCCGDHMLSEHWWLQLLSCYFAEGWLVDEAWNMEVSACLTWNDTLTIVDTSMKYWSSASIHCLIAAYLSLTSVLWLIDSDQVQPSWSADRFHILRSSSVGNACSKQTQYSIKVIALRMTNLSSYPWILSWTSFDSGDIIMLVYCGHLGAVVPCRAGATFTAAD